MRERRERRARSEKEVFGSVVVMLDDGAQKVSCQFSTPQFIPESVRILSYLVPLDLIWLSITISSYLPEDLLDIPPSSQHHDPCPSNSMHAESRSSRDGKHSRDDNVHGGGHSFESAWCMAVLPQS